MKRTLIFLTITLIFFVSCKNSNRQYYTINGYAQGGTYRITYCEKDSVGKKTMSKPQDIKASADELLLLIDNTISGYNKGSILSKINQNITDSLNPLFVEVFNLSTEIHKETNGFFDISGSPLYDLWGFGFKNQSQTTNKDIEIAKSLVGLEKFSIKDNKIIKNNPAQKLNFNAIAQGYSCDLVGRMLETKGITDYLVEVGGEILCKGKNSKGKNWTIAVDTPKDGNMESGAYISGILSVSNVGIVTSGNYRKFYIKDGKKYSHTINPKTGYPVTHNLLSATIIAKDAASADAYATYCMVIGIEEAIKFLESRQDLGGYLIYGEQDQMKIYFTENIKDQIKQN